MTKKALRDYAIAIGTFILAGGVWRFTKSPEAVAALCAAGGAVIGRLFKQPDYAQKAKPE